MQRLEVNCAVRHIYIYVVSRLRVKYEVPEVNCVIILVIKLLAHRDVFNQKITNTLPVLLPVQKFRYPSRPKFSYLCISPLCWVRTLGGIPQSNSWQRRDTETKKRG
jgi:hypothetical protein